MFLENETSEKHVEAIVAKVCHWVYCVLMKYHLPNIELKIKLQMDGLKKRLSRWREVTAREFPDRPDLLDMIPAPDGISIKKLNKGTINTDTCNAAQKDRRLLVQEAGDDVTIYQQDCMQHLRCVWINGVSKAINVFMRAFLNDSLEEISSFLIPPSLARSNARDHCLPQRVQPHSQLS